MWKYCFDWGDHLTNNKTKSCGCYRKEMPKIRDRIDLTNQTFGRLTAIKIDESRTDDVYWLCKCNCGNPNLKSILAYSLRSGHTKSCGCLKSKGEEKIIKALVDLNISFEQEKKYPNLISDKGNPLRFDFYLPDYNCIIEF